MLRAIIVDDERKGVDTLRMLIDLYLEDVKVVAESTKPFLAKELIEDYKPEIVFLDINMPGMSGFELLENLKWKEFNLVFTTAHQEYALKALKNNAIDYLLKPLDHQDLVNAVGRIRKKILETSHENPHNYNELFKWVRPSYQHKILISSKSGVEHVFASEILYLESQSNYTKVFLIDRSEIMSSKTLKEFDNQLCVKDYGFMRVHHSFIINLNQVSRYLKNPESIVMSNNQIIPVSRSKRPAFFSWMKI